MLAGWAEIEEGRSWWNMKATATGVLAVAGQQGSRGRAEVFLARPGNCLSMKMRRPR
jgi:hypothetical protein